MAFNSKRPNYIGEFTASPIMVDNSGQSIKNPYTEDSELFKIENNLKQVLQTQHTLFQDDVFEETFTEEMIPSKLVDVDQNQFVEFDIPTESFVKMREMFLSFQIPLNITSIGDPTTFLPYESRYFSNTPQSAFTFVQVIKEINASIGNRETQLIPDGRYTRNNAAWRVHMQKRKVSPDEDLLRSQLGLSCSKSNAAVSYCNMNSKNYVDSIWYNYLYSTTGLTQSSLTKTFTIALADLIPFFDCDYFLRPNIPMKVGIYFQLPNNFKSFTGAISSLQNVGGIIYPQNFTRPVNLSSVKIHYQSRKMYADKYEMFKALPRTIINSYHYYQFIQENLQPVNNLFTFTTQLKERPLEILLYFTNNTAGYSLPGKLLNVNAFYTPVNGYIAGLNIKALRVYLTDRQPFNVFGLDTNINMSNPGYFVSDMPAASIIMNRTEQRVDENINKFTYVPSNLNMLDNIVPLSINVEKTWDYNKNTRQSHTGVVNVKIEIEFANNFTWINVNNNTQASVVGSNLPPGTTINYLFKYPYQVLIDQNNSAVGITYPLQIKDDNISTLNSSINP
jgi:hypothetical protein